MGISARTIRLSLELNAGSISAAVDSYIHYKVGYLAKLKRYPGKRRDAIMRHLLSNARDTFLWVALDCEALNKAPRGQIPNLNAFPPGLDSLYERMMHQIEQLDNSDLYNQILAVVSTVYRPITLDELPCFVETLRDLVENDNFSRDSSFSSGNDDGWTWVQDEDTRTDNSDPSSAYENNPLADVIRSCGSFLTLRERTVYFVHQSAKDFLRTKRSAQIFPSGIETVHRSIFSLSLTALSSTLRRDIYDLRQPGFPIEDVDPPKPDPLATMCYSCIYWIDHLHDCDPTAREITSLTIRNSIYEFFCQNYRHWLETLSLLRSLSAGQLSMARLERSFQVCYLHTCEGPG